MTSKEAFEKIDWLLGKNVSKLKFDKKCNSTNEMVKCLLIIKKDLEALETIKDNCGLVYEDGNTYFKVNIREYDYLRRPIEDFDKVKHLAERN